MLGSMSDPELTSAPAGRPLLPPYKVVRDFLPAETVAALLDFTLANEPNFTVANVGVREQVRIDTTKRISRASRDLGPFRDILVERLGLLGPALTAALNLPPFALRRIETELVAHGDGAFYARHIDTARPGAEAGTQRVLSGVYYFHATPKAFEGGALRLHELMPRAGRTPEVIDIPPLHNSAVFFAAWMPHEVMPVRVPSRRFADSRFAINCWFRRPAPER